MTVLRGRARTGAAEPSGEGPNDHVCIDLPGLDGTPATELVNETSGVALLYATEGCVGHPMDAVAPGRATVVRTYSVVFVPAG
ncbi:hypothetical protein [Streptomyces sp. NPDC002990]